MSKFLQWAQTERQPATRFAVTLLAGVFFLFLLPYLFIVVCPAIDQRLGIGEIDLGVANFILGGILMVIGLFFALWSIEMELTRGRGTPLPIMPTQDLLTTGPFRYCRNPMTLGAILGYLGLCIVVGTLVGAALVIALAALLLLYLKRVEEKELAERFGEPYLAYKQQVPFIIPKLW